ncbi:MAG: glycosyltransferase [Verrucomicrobia bacterium]|nr:glycosyltransferase [Verrucomicrobiota bacterium]MCG2681655.1 glycosyltransferase [Kiritimatiellia bacterium]MBU4248107.1 glycosyltransferase [Verrucomicrobiota bacterium]MBU4290783.1 glycosyltransferase [Verrucomicrobiota bacterium]MBU4429742.1 glycosyltransferase [Verrucomicrobiota bacterium]
MHIHQILAGYADGDAISNEAVRLREIFRRWGHSSEIYADPDRISPSLKSDCRLLADYSAGPGDLCLHHYGIASPAADVFLASPAKKIMVYHNITPAEYFDGFDDDVAAQLRAARSALREVARHADAVWTVSQFNAAELRAEGIEGIKVFPLLFAPESQDMSPAPLILNKFSGSLKNILFVGRIAPNKRVEDLILAFAWYHLALNPFSRLIIVGSKQSAPRYYTMLRMLAGDLDLPNVCFEGFASPPGLAAYYQVADLYVCPSVHEGYCLPLLEAMYKGVPVIAHRAGGMPEAMDGAGILYQDLAPVELAELMHRTLSNPALRNDVLRSQDERVRRLRERPVEAELKALLSDCLPPLACGSA